MTDKLTRHSNASYTYALRDTADMYQNDTPAVCAVLRDCADIIDALTEKLER